MQGIKEDPESAILYSNRSAALLQLRKAAKALEDAEQCISLRPDWDKGHYRKGLALELQGAYNEVFHRSILHYFPQQIMCTERHPTLLFESLG